MRRRQRGQAVLELAVVIGVLFVLIAGLAFVAPRISVGMRVTAAARQGAQAAADTVDEINGALSCTKSTVACMTTAMTLIRTMVDAGLPCQPGDNTAYCVQATQQLASQAISLGVQVCLGGAPRNGCNVNGAIAVAMLATQAESCAGLNGCLVAAEIFSEAAMEAGLGCQQSDPCPPPLSMRTGTPWKPTSTPGPPCCAARFTRFTAVEIISGVAQKALVCAAVRRSLGLGFSTTTCDQTKHDDPWVSMPTGLIPYACVTATPVTTQLFSTICPPQGGTDYMAVAQVTVHWDAHGVAATAAAAPASQFIS